MPQAVGQYCLGIFNNYEPSLVLGAIAIVDHQLIFDRDHDRIGFFATDCAAAAAAASPRVGHAVPVGARVGDDECAPDDVDAGWRIRYLLHAALYRARASARAVSAAVTGGHGAAFWAVLLAGVALGAALASAALELARRRRSSWWGGAAAQLPQRARGGARGLRPAPGADDAI